MRETKSDVRAPRTCDNRALRYYRSERSSRPCHRHLLPYPIRDACPHYFAIRTVRSSLRPSSHGRRARVGGFGGFGGFGGSSVSSRQQRRHERRVADCSSARPAGASRSPLPPPSSPGWQTQRFTQQGTRSDREGTRDRQAGASRRWPHFPTTSRARHAASAPIRAYGSRVTWRCMWRPTREGLPLIGRVAACGAEEDVTSSVFIISP